MKAAVIILLIAINLQLCSIGTDVGTLATASRKY